MIPSYGKINTVGHRDLTKLFDGPVVVQEKIDGSQFSAMVDDDLVLYCCSKSSVLDLEHPQKLFGPAVEHMKKVQSKLAPGRVYRFEAMNRPKHNVLAYERVPVGNLVLYDVTLMHRNGFTLPIDQNLASYADFLEVECVQEIHRGEALAADIMTFLSAKPQLGGAMIEGVVVKNYAEGLKGKYVAPRFQEIMHGRPARAPKAGIVEQLSHLYCSEARWEKAVSHLRDEGKLKDSVADIGNLIKEIQRDITEECAPDILEALFNYHIKDLRNGWIAGFPEWYKKRVLV